MINFFRKIRKKLADDNKPMKYMRYAVGEIALVVIGILIAISINNWNEERKYKQQEQNILMELKANLQASKTEIENMIKHNAQTVDNYKALLNHVKEKLPYHDSLNIYFGKLTNWSTPFLNFSAFETLKSKGTDLISNSHVKGAIIDLYEVKFANLYDHDKMELEYVTTVVNPFKSRFFETITFEYPRLIKPNNYVQIVNNQEFINILSILIYRRSKGVRMSTDILQFLNQVIENIQIEIDLLN